MRWCGMKQPWKEVEVRDGWKVSSGSWISSVGWFAQRTVVAEIPGKVRSVSIGVRNMTRKGSW